jgi:acido-empty-quinoprotein group A
MRGTLIGITLGSLAAPSLVAQGLSHAGLLQPAPDTWPTYNGDYSGRRYSELNQINAANVHELSLAWTTRFTAEYGTVQIKATPLLVNGVLYFSAPNSVWAADAKTGRPLWHYQYTRNSGSTIGNRGVGMYGNWLYFESPDSHLISLDARTGKERWKIEIADPKLDYTSTAAPIVVGDHILVGIGGDHLDNPGFLESRDPETGALQWKWWTTLRKGEPGIETWPTEQVAIHGTGQTWIPGTYDPELNLYYIGIGNRNPVLAGQGRKGDNLYTCSIVALNSDTGKMAWYFQASPHDTHDWDAVQTPILIDGVIDGKPRKLLAQASRNGYFFLLDRTNGANIVTRPYIDTLNWSKGVNVKGQPIPDPAAPVLKKSRWLLLKRDENLKTEQRFRLRDLLRYNLKTVRVYLLKEAFQQLWDYNSPAWAGKFLDEWCRQVMRSRIEPHEEDRPIIASASRTDPEPFSRPKTALQRCGRGSE